MSWHQLLGYQVALCLFGFVWAQVSWAGTEEIRPFQLRSCQANVCYVLEAPVAYRSPLDNIFVFAQAELRIEKKGGGQQIRRDLGGDGYYDPQLSRIVLREIQAKKYRDLLVNLMNGRVMEF